MAELTYLLCALTSIFCAGLLIRSYRQARLRLALLAAICFVGLALNNIAMFVDLVLVPSLDLRLPRELLALGALLVLVVGLVTEER
jgi:hypothetical protein